MAAKKSPRQKVPKLAPAPPEPEALAQPEPASNHGRRKWYVALFVGGGLLFAATIFLVLSGVLAEPERRLFGFINHAFLPDWLAEQVAKPISNAVWGMIALVSVLLAVPRFRLLAWQYAVAGGLAGVLVYVVEFLVGRARPAGLEGYDVVARAVQDGHGFPSSHVAVLAALALAVWPFVAWYWRVFLVFLVGVEAWARIFLGVHAPLDVLGAVALAMLVVGGLHLLPAKIRGFLRLGA